MAVDNKNIYQWVVAYVHKDYFDSIALDFIKSGYSGIKVSVPSVRILVKRFKNERIFNRVPLLFNYGFIRLPNTIIYNRDELENMKKGVEGIVSWLYVPIKDLKYKEKKIRENFKEYRKELKKQGNWDKDTDIQLKASMAITLRQVPKVYVVKEAEIRKLEQCALHYSTFCAEDLKKINIGQTILLKGYPFEDIPAEIVNINFSKQKVKVKLLVQGNTLVRNIELDFENVFYTIYSHFDPDLTSGPLLENTNPTKLLSYDRGG